MSRYSTILLDADDTLFDFVACEREALILSFERFGINYNEDTRAAYAKINEDLWKQYEKGLIDRETIINNRFRILFDRFDIRGEKEGFEEVYQEFLGMQHIMIDGAMQVIKYLSNKYDLYIVTNGVTKTQSRRFRESGIEPYVKRLFVSEETGFQKPMKEYFDYCFERINNLRINEVIIIGDSLSSDIKGGNNAGITTCWYNPKALINNTDSRVDIEIRQLSELYEIL